MWTSNNTCGICSMFRSAIYFCLSVRCWVDDWINYDRYVFQVPKDYCLRLCFISISKELSSLCKGILGIFNGKEDGRVDIGSEELWSEFDLKFLDIRIWIGSPGFRIKSPDFRIGTSTFLKNFDPKTQIFSNIRNLIIGSLDRISGFSDGIYLSIPRGWYVSAFFLGLYCRTSLFIFNCNVFFSWKFYIKYNLFLFGNIFYLFLS